MWLPQKGLYEVQKISERHHKTPVTLCNLGVGATFGESILHDLPRDSTVVTKTTCELLRVEQQDFRLIWEKNKELMNDIITNNSKLKNGFGQGVSPATVPSPTKRPLSPDHPNPALPITESPSPAMSRMGWALRTLLVADNSSCLRDRKVSGKLIRKCAPGTELVDWLQNLSPIVHTRAQAAGMWQALLEEGVLSHVNKEQPFKDKCFLYRFRVDEEGTGGGPPQADDISAANEHIREALSTLLHRGPDAILRMILRKPSHERTQEELELVFEELLHIAALSHLSTSIKRELASIIVFEAHAHSGTILFNQGDEGRSWYILLKGSVDVVIHGKGTVATLKEGDDFGKLALINDAPRAATIVLKENNCHLLRVDKEHFNRILRDVEANTLRLQEHGKDVLVLERVAKQRGHSAFKQRDQQLEDAFIQAYAFNMLQNPDEMVEGEELEAELPDLDMNDEQFQTACGGLNLQQRELFNLVTRSIQEQLSGSENRLRLFVTGGAGVDKTYTFNTVKNQVNRCYGRKAVMVMALTGVAARLVNGSTLHSMLKIPGKKDGFLTPNMALLTRNYLRIMRQQWKDIEFIFIDEISMVPYEMLCMIDSQLRQLKNRDNKPFGGINIIVFGDLMQLPPVRGAQVFRQPALLLPATHLWRLFTLVELTQNMRRQGDTSFADILNALRIGEMTAQHFELLMSKMLMEPTGEFAINKAIRIYPLRKQVDDHNAAVLNYYRTQGERIYKIHAQDRLVDATRNAENVNMNNIVSADVNKTGGMPKELEIFVGAKIMLRSNIDLQKGLVNGSMGNIIEIVWPYFRRDQVYDDDVPWVRVDFGRDGVHLIEPRTVQFPALFNYGTVERRMLPMILYWACTVHKMQGCTVDHAVVYLGKIHLSKKMEDGLSIFQDGQAYVAHSRVRSLEGVRILDLDCTKLIGKKPCNEDAIREMERMRNYQPPDEQYTVMSGTPSKMLEHLLETRLGGQVGPNDPFLDDFLLTHVVFMPVPQLVDELANYFHSEPDGSQSPEDREYTITFRKRVVHFVQKWVIAVRHAVFEDPIVCDFIEDLASEVEVDPDLSEEAGIIHHVLTQLSRYQEDRNMHAGQKWKLPPNGQPICLFSGNATSSRTVIRPDDDIIFRVYCADHTYCTLRFPLHTTAEIIKACAADKLQLNRGPEDLQLVEVKSNGERSVFKDTDVSVPTGLSLNGRIFVSTKDHLDALSPLPEQEGPTEGLDIDIEVLSTKELAYHITLFDWDLFWAVHEYELLYHTFGRHHFGKITSNLDVFVRRFNEIQYWVVTEIVSTASMGKRVALLRKFIKLAAYCKEYQNLNAFFAVVMGLANMAISRLQQSWDKLPSKFKKLFQEFEALIDPSRNHRAYRVFVGKLQPPVIPFMPLLLKDMTFAHEGNKTSLDGLVNFEKMHMMAQTMRTIRFCRSRHLVLDPPSPKSEGEVRSYISCMRAIDNQRVVMAMSQKIEPNRKL